MGHQFCLHPTSCCHCQSNNVCCSSYLLWSFLVFCLSLSVSYGCHQYVVMLGTFCFLWSLLVFCLSLSVSCGCHQYVAAHPASCCHCCYKTCYPFLISSVIVNLVSVVRPASCRHRPSSVGHPQRTRSLWLSSIGCPSSCCFLLSSLFVCR